MTEDEYKSFKNKLKFLSLDQLLDLTNNLHKQIQEGFRMNKFRNLLTK